MTLDLMEFKEFLEVNAPAVSNSSMLKVGISLNKEDDIFKCVDLEVKCLKLIGFYEFLNSKDVHDKNLFILVQFMKIMNTTLPQVVPERYNKFRSIPNKDFERMVRQYVTMFPLCYPYTSCLAETNFMY